MPYSVKIIECYGDRLDTTTQHDTDSVAVAIAEAVKQQYGEKAEFGGCPEEENSSRFIGRAMKRIFCGAGYLFITDTISIELTETGTK